MMLIQTRTQKRRQPVWKPKHKLKVVADVVAVETVVVEIVALVVRVQVADNAVVAHKVAVMPVVVDLAVEEDNVAM
jgi:hypothetical protein